MTSRERLLEQVLDDLLLAAANATPSVVHSGRRQALREAVGRAQRLRRAEAAANYLEAIGNTTLPEPDLPPAPPIGAPMPPRPERARQVRLPYSDD